MADDFKKLKIWQKAHNLMLKVYDLSNLFPKEEMFNLTSQIRRAALSVPANIAEAQGRFHMTQKRYIFYTTREDQRKRCVVTCRLHSICLLFPKKIFRS